MSTNLRLVTVEMPSKQKKLKTNETDITQELSNECKGRPKDGQSNLLM